MSRILVRFPGNKTKAVTFSYDDGSFYDRKLIEIFDKYGLKATFNLNSLALMDDGEENNPSYPYLYKSEIKEAYKNHEIAVHTQTHPLLDSLQNILITKEIYEDRKELEKLSGSIVTGMAYPFGAFSNENVGVCMKACGISYSRSVSSTRGFRLPNDWYNWCPTCHHGDEKLMSLADSFLSDNRANGDAWLFYCWGHAFEFHKHNNWEIIENLAEKISGKDEIWYATNIEIYNYLTAYSNLVFSVDCSMVFNPSGLTVCFKKDGKEYSIKPGEALKL